MTGSQARFFMSSASTELRRLVLRQCKLFPHLLKSQATGLADCAGSRTLAAAAACACSLHSLAGRARPALLLGQHVREALQNGEPVVAFESTVITHGLPEPENLELAQELEWLVSRWEPQTGGALDGTLAATEAPTREPQAAGPTLAVTPATIGIVRGQLIVGLSAEQIVYLAARKRSSPIKASRRDLAIATALGLSAGTTVAATMAIASSVRHAVLSATSSAKSGGAHSYSPIKVFATGGTGGVHLGGELSMDVSADLYEFARSPMGVVASGFKSFLDTRRSLEFLETMGCTVMSLAQSAPTLTCSSRANGPATEACGGDQARENSNSVVSNDDDDFLFPAFFSATNKQRIRSPRVVRSVAEAAQILFHCLEAPLANVRASLLAVPIPRKFSLDEEEDETLRVAMANVAAIDKRTDLEGKEKTPLILAELNRATRGKTLEANMELLKNNALVGAQLAYEYALLANRTGTNGEEQHEGKSSAPEKLHCGDGSGPVLVVGCTMIDMHVSTKIDARFKTNPRHSGVTFEGRPHLTLGGVGRNLATALEFLGHKPSFITSLASDSLGSFALQELHKAGLAGDRLRVSWLAGSATKDAPSSCFALVLVDSIDGQCEYVIANLEAARAIDGRMLEAEARRIGSAPLVVADANLSAEAIERLIGLCHQHGVPLFVEPTDVVALPRLVGCLRRVQSRMPNCLESLLCLSPNLIELEQMLRMFEGDQAAGGDATTSNVAGAERVEGAEKEEDMPLNWIEHMVGRLMQTHLPQLKCLLVTLDRRGVLVAIRGAAPLLEREPLEQVKLMELVELRCSGPGNSIVRTKHFANPTLIERPLSASGAGDSFAAGFIGGLLQNLTIGQCLEKGFQASMLALQDEDTIPRALKSLALNKQC